MAKTSRTYILRKPYNRRTHRPISLPAFAEAGYKTVHFVLPNFGSSEAKTFPVAADWQLPRIY